MKKIVLIIVGILIVASLSSAYNVSNWKKDVACRSIVVAAPAVGQTKNGYFGVITHINVTMMNGSGHVYFAASPLTQIDMQGSAKLAVDVACALTGKDENKYDFLFYVKSDSPIVGGPSAGATMTVAAIALLENLSLNNSIAMTGMINPDGSIGPVGGILEKGEAVAKAGKKLFLIPKGQMIEYETEYKQEGGWIISQRVPVNVSQKLHDEYGLTVKEVEDINQAFYYFTGYKFNESKSSKPITTFDYRNIMMPLALNLSADANESYIKAKEIYDNTNIPIGSWFFSPRGRIGNYLNDAEKALRDGNTAFSNGFYYYSISKFFQSMINSRFVRYACMFYKNGSLYDSLYNNATNYVNNAYYFARKLEMNGLISLQCVGAAQSRAVEAVNLLNNSLNEWHSYIRYGNDEKALQALYDLAYGEERAKTVFWWANLSKKFEDSYKINDTLINGLARKYYDYAKQIFAYAQTLVKETGSQQSYINNANDLLDKASNEIENFPAASLFNSLESIANSNLAIESIGGLTEDKVNRSSQMASYSISKARDEGIEPILAVSYYEFGNSLKNMGDAIIYYKYAYMIANMLRLSKGFNESKPEYIGNENDNGNAVSSNFYNYIFIILSFIIGIAIGYAVKGRKGRKKEEEEEWHKEEREEDYYQ